MKIPFNVQFRPQIESGEYKVFALEHEEQEARIVCWDNKGDYPIIALVDNEPEKFDKHGRIPGGNRGGEFSLFIITPEPELSEFEKGFLERVFHQKAEDLDEQNKEIFLEDARYVLALAREQFIKDGYVIEKKAFHDAVGNISDKHRAEMSVQYSLHCKVEDGTRHAIMNWEAFQKVAQTFIDIGKAEALKEIEQDPESSYAFKRGVEYGKEEALKDLPRWRKWEGGACGNSDGHPIALVSGVGGIRFTSVLGATGQKYIMLDDLKKLPGFND